MNTDLNKVEILCLNNKVKKEYPIGTSLQEIYNDMKPSMKYGTIVAKVNNVTKDLKFKVIKPKTIEFLGTDVPSGMRAYVRSLSFIFCKAMRKLYPSLKVRIEHPIAKGYYCLLLGQEGKITQEMVDAIKQEMKKTVEKDLPFSMQTILTEEAEEIFNRQGAEDTAQLLHSRGEIYTNVYELDGEYDWYLGPMAPSTGYINLFDLHLYHDGLFLQVPDRKDPVRLEPILKQDKLFETFSEHTEWNNIMKLGNVGKMNEVVRNKKNASALIKVAEALQEKKIVAIADEIAKRKDVKLVLIAGPSSSGKTTFSKRLSVQMAVNGQQPIALSMDDYFVPREQTPRDEKGDYDFEALNAVDLELFNKQVNQLMAGEEVELPYYNFETGLREYRGNKIRLGEKGILVIEGIHALNPELTSKIADNTIFRVYISALTTISLDNHNWIPTTDNRLLRRIIRDYNYRGYSAIDTISRWGKVMAGEEKWIFPYQENADMVFNSALLFEICVLKKFAEPVLSEVPQNSPHYSEVHRLQKFLKYFAIVPEVELPLTSLLREFLGGSTFSY